MGGKTVKNGVVDTVSIVKHSMQYMYCRLLQRSITKMKIYEKSDEPVSLFFEVRTVIKEVVSAK